MDKQQIIDQARRIGTFDTFVIPDQDCCQLFGPRLVHEAESSLDLAALTDLGVTGAEIINFAFPPDGEHKPEPLFLSGPGG